MPGFGSRSVLVVSSLVTVSVFLVVCIIMTGRGSDGDYLLQQLPAQFAAAEFIGVADTARIAKGSRYTFLLTASALFVDYIPHDLLKQINCQESSVRSAAFAAHH